MGKIVVCGGTGIQGGAVTAALLRSGYHHVVTLTPDPASETAGKILELGAEVAAADLTDVRSLTSAFEGAAAVFGVTRSWSPDSGRFEPEAEVRQARNIIWASLTCGVEQVVISTIIGDKPKVTGVPYIDSKRHIETLFRKYLPEGVILRPGLFMENIGADMLKLSGEQLVGRFSPDAVIPLVALDDIGRAAVEIFGDLQRYKGKTLDVAGDLVSGSDLALMAAGAIHRRVRYQAQNEWYLRFFKPLFFHMRRYFEEQGRSGVAWPFEGLFSPVSSETFIQRNAGWLFDR